MTSLCLDKYNKRKGFNVKLEHVLRANFNPGGRTTYYITFAARESDSPDAPLVEYQVKVDWSAGNTYPILCRPTSPPQLVEGSRGDLMRSSTQEPTMEKIMGEKQQPRSSQVGILTKFYPKLQDKANSAYPRRPLSIFQSRRRPRSIPPAQRSLGIHSQLNYRQPRRRISPNGVHTKELFNFQTG
ncbi:uncharacterized protein LOC9308221 [Arabidopsis lyrata subsp. lyrata]|uniref:uncharacterized protein LOC9308221 n=1 Tax=Arabidopsis lyrata subsp. lyrata TaxID=81972 RepID=UPI000A29AB88|nr:uncharacterized protein LOC9308221 [Arabidopsis lyrata subsp. lyrata]|eukprot:XP_020879191.1 uncharacterized protein LOC9308221 [Arabidopsis lyrata subsp. lyrata]